MVPDPVGVVFDLGNRLHPVFPDLFVVKFVGFLRLECLVHDIKILYWFFGEKLLANRYCYPL
jgi:hypothetical protein